MAAFFRTIRQRQQHISYFVICFLLFALALALAKAAGWWAVIALWIVLVGLLELVYRWTVALGYRNRRTWWAKRQSHNYWFVFRWAFLALVVAGLLCAVIIRRMGRRDLA
jgi:heme O synthase-like polyprenyltransferase